MRILAIDYGRKRIGLALSDPLGITAQPHGALANDAKFFPSLAELVREREVSEVVLGYPRSLSGRPGPMAREVEGFADKLRKTLTVPIHFWDERFTTSESEQVLIQGEVRREKRKEVRDAMAASLILQGYLQSLTHPL